MAKHLGARIWTAGLTGIPFGIYKMGFGWYEYQHGHPAPGLVAMAWGAIDIGLNAAAVMFPKNFGYCLISNLGRWIDRLTGSKNWANILLGVDTLLSFSIVSVMIWFGRLPLEPTIMAHVWNLAVVCNVLAVGLQQIWQAITDKEAPDPAA